MKAQTLAILKYPPLSIGEATHTLQMDRLVESLVNNMKVSLTLVNLKLLQSDFIVRGICTFLNKAKMLSLFSNL